MHLQLRAIKPRSTFTRAIIYRPFLIIGQSNSPRPVGGIKFANDLNTTGYADTRVETETGLQYTFNETVALRVNYYLERGFNMDDSRNNGEFSTQEIRAYLPLTLGNHSVTPYTRIGLDRWSNWDWQDDIEREGHDFNRVGLFYGYDFQNGLSVSLEYAFEWQDHDEGDSDKFHYAGVGVNYSF